jgi:hypothetical protein
MLARELTAAEREGVRRLVVGFCANYAASRKLCLAREAPCYMFEKYYAGAYCRYFRNAVLPLDPALCAALTKARARVCAACGKEFPQKGKRRYCSSACADEAKKRLQRGYMQKRRGKR